MVAAVGRLQEYQLAAVITATQQQGERQERIAIEQHKQLEFWVKELAERHWSWPKTLVSSWGGCGGSRGMLRSTLTRQRQTDLERRVTSLKDLHLTVEATVSKLNGPDVKSYAPV